MLGSEAATILHRGDSHQLLELAAEKINILVAECLGDLPHP